MADNEQIDIPVLVKTPSAPDGSLWGTNRFANVFGRAFRTIARHPVILAAAALVIGGFKAVGAWREKEKALNALNQALLNQGIYSKELSLQYQELSLAIQKETAYSDEEVMAAQASMQGYLGSTVVSKEILMTVADFAQAQGISLTSAADMVAKSIGTTINPLARYGIALEEGMSKQEKLDAVLGGLNRRFHGQATAHAQGLGAVNQMANALNNVLERIGQSLAPMVAMFASQIAKSATEMMNSPALKGILSESIDNMGVVASFLKNTIGGVQDVSMVLMKGWVAGWRGILTQRFKDTFIEMANLQKELNDIPIKRAKEFLASRTEILATRKSYDEAHQKNLLSAFARGKSGKAVRTEKEKERSTFLNAKSEKKIFEEMAHFELRKNKDIKRLNEAMASAKDDTERLQLELKKSKIISDKIMEKQEQHERRISLFKHFNNKANLNIQKDGLAYLSELKNSKYGPQIIIGKAATGAAIVVNTSIAIPSAIAACAAIPPPAGEALGTAFASFIAAYAAEQLANIADISIDNPGRIGEMPFNLETALQRVWGTIGDNMALASRVGAAVFDKVGDISDTLGDEVEKALGDVGGIVDFQLDVLAAQYRVISQIYEKVYGAIAKLITGLTDFIAGVVADVMAAIGNAIADAAEAVFGWLFAEGGAVTHIQGSPVVTPLHKSGIRFGTEVNVRIRGGLVPSHGEARRLAHIIHSQMRS